MTFSARQDRSSGARRLPGGRPWSWPSGWRVAGCRSRDSLPSLQVYEVKGKVLLADGKPLSGGWVYFVPKGDLTVTPSAEIGSDGTFSLVTGGSGEGRRRAITRSASKHRSSVQSEVQESAFPFKYTDEDSSGLVVTVRAEPISWNRSD